MSVRSCRVTIQDLDGTSHTAEVTASSLFEAVAQGLAALRKNEWVDGIEERFGFVKVSVADVRVEHQVKIADFMKWLERPVAPHRKSRIASESGQFSECLCRGDLTPRRRVSTFKRCLQIAPKSKGQFGLLSHRYFVDALPGQISFNTNLDG